MSDEGIPLIRVKHLKKWFPVRVSVLKSIIRRRARNFVRAVDGISFKIEKEEILGLVGESGCGKTTTGKLLASLERPTSGEIFFKGMNLVDLKGKRLQEHRRNIQMIFQDPYQAFDPRYNVRQIIMEPLTVQKVGSSKERLEIIYDTLEKVELKPPEAFFDKYPHKLSGGQRQRVATCRAIILRPKVVIADEPVSMLDMSVRASALNLMRNLRDSLGISYLFITHDLSVARYVCDRIMVMYMGKIVETGQTEKVILNPRHPYTQLLLASVPIPDPFHRRPRPSRIREPPSPINLASGCKFHPRCPYRDKLCTVTEPQLQRIKDGRSVACHFFERI